MCHFNTGTDQLLGAHFGFFQGQYLPLRVSNHLEPNDFKLKCKLKWGGIKCCKSDDSEGTCIFWKCIITVKMKQNERSMLFNKFLFT